MSAAIPMEEPVLSSAAAAAAIRPELPAAKLPCAARESILQAIHERGDRIVAVILLLHALLALSLAHVYDTWFATGVLSACALGLFAASRWLLPGAAFTRTVAGISLQIFVALHIYQMHGLAEMHFFFFTAFTVLMVYQDWRCMWAGALGIIVQHTAFAYLHNSGGRIFFFEEDNVGFPKLFFHFGIAIAHVIICGYWAELMRRQTLASGQNNQQLSQTNSQLLSEMGERMRAEVAMRLAKEEAERANLAKSEFLSRMSHELRTPLNAILGFSQLLELEPLSTDQRQSVKHVLKGGTHLLNLINEVLDIARIEAGGLEFSLEPIALRPLVEEAMTLVNPLARQRQIFLQIAEGGEIPGGVYVQADLQRLKQVLLNLLSNAIKYNYDSGQVTVSWEFLSGGTSAPADQKVIRWLRLAFKDTGRGIEAHLMNRLFTPFDRLGAEHEEVEGSGIGLALSKRLVEAMGGSIGVISTPSLGSTFYIDLPLAAAPLIVGGALDEQSMAITMEGHGLPQRTVLQIEDNLANRQVIERVLEMRPRVRLLSAIQGQMGLELAREHQPDLVLLDLNLPDLSGTEVLCRLQADPLTAHIPVVVLSADATPNQMQRILRLGARDYLTKPFQLGKLMQVLDEILAEPATALPS